MTTLTVSTARLAASACRSPSLGQPAPTPTAGPSFEPNHSHPPSPLLGLPGWMAPIEPASRVSVVTRGAPFEDARRDIAVVAQQ